MEEKVSVFTPLGIRFWDPVLDRQVDDYLIVKAYPGSGSGPVVDAFRTASGVYAFQGLPGLREVEFCHRDGVPPEKPFIIEVKDKLRRFLPVIFEVELPLPYRGIYRSVDDSPESQQFYLLSAPTRTVSAGLAVIHGALVEKTTGEPAAYAVMEVDVESSNGGEDLGKWYGMADERGCISILFPYPDMEVSLSKSPPSSSPVPLEQQEWQLTIQVRYAPGDLRYPTAVNIETEIPLLESILNQSEGRIWTDSDSFVNQWSTELIFGEALILTTEVEDNKSELWID